MEKSTINASLDEIIIFKEALHKGIYLLENALEEVHPYINEITLFYDTLSDEINQKIQIMDRKIDIIEDQIHEYLSSREEILSNDSYLDTMYRRKENLEYQRHQVMCYLHNTREIFNNAFEFISITQRKNENTLANSKTLLQKSDQLLISYCALLQKPKQIISNQLETSTTHNTMNPKILSSVEKRITHCPSQNSTKGHWEGTRGKSAFIPKDKKIKKLLKDKNLESIQYKDGIPDFSIFCNYQNTILGDFIGIVEIGHMVTSRHSTGYNETPSRKKEDIYQYCTQTEIGNYEQADIVLAKKQARFPAT